MFRMGASFIAFLLAFVTLVVSDTGVLKTPEEMKLIHQTCSKETGHEGMISSIKAESATKESKCYLKCVMGKKDVIKSDGTFDIELAKAYISIMPKLKNNPELKEKALKAIEECAAEVKIDVDDLCESAYQLFVCKHKKLLP